MAQQMTATRWLAATTAAVLMLSSCAIGDSNQQTDTAQASSATSAEPMQSEGNEAEGSGHPIEIAEIDEAFTALVSCLEPDLDGYFRADFNRYVSMDGEYGLSDGRRDEALVEDLFNKCAESTGFESGIGRFLETHTLSQEDIRMIDTELNQCVDQAGLADDSQWTERPSPQTIDDIVEVSLLVPRVTDPPSAEALFDCVQRSLYGPRIDF